MGYEVVSHGKLNRKQEDYSLLYGMSELDEEIQSLKSFYCQPGEFEVQEFGNSKQILVHLKHNQPSQEPILINVDLRVPESYPERIPDIIINSSQLTHEVLTIIHKDATGCADQNLGQAMIFVILCNIQDNLDKLVDEEYSLKVPEEDETGDVWNCLLLLDHMRAKSKYIKTIHKWTQELDLKGRLLFCGKLILILLQGQHVNIKEYLIRHRSVNVDVDSHGRSCKERMMSVICEEKATGSKRFLDFTVMEYDLKEDLVKLFSDFDMSLVYCKYIKDVYL
ncbi:RWD domain-containing protein 3 [Mytilus coruscus]|uniref:RWD domain-containing protein 3 n=1 Tax=Mytilus coruscus TaxID=42192 RepID=A0A6J8DJ75_MYTCO|nr:RWD domain-containing protein 3 [Mytilus coruscus]